LVSIKGRRRKNFGNFLRGGGGGGELYINMYILMGRLEFTYVVLIKGNEKENGGGKSDYVYV